LSSCDSRSNAFDHLQRLPKAKQTIVIDEVDQHLQHQPMLASRKRRVLRPNPLAPWELRLGEVRVFYEVLETPSPMVMIKAIGLKENNDLYVGGERIEL
jgi:mRNA-degrading endonuclease RelE of RelBE toxin-antitoxin system